MIVILRARSVVNLQDAVDLLRKYTGPRYSVTFSVFSKSSNRGKTILSFGCCEECQTAILDDHIMKGNHRLIYMSQAILYDNTTSLRFELRSKDEVNVEPIEIM